MLKFQIICVMVLWRYVMIEPLRFLFVMVSAFLVSLVLYHLGIAWNDWMLVLVICVLLACVQTLGEVLYDWWRS